MKSLSHVLMTAVFVGMATCAVAATPSSAVLNKLEVQKFVAADTLLARLRLATHFSALANQFITDAARHRATATVFRANTTRSATTTAGDQSDRLAARDEKWAGAALELAMYYGDLAEGIEAILPARAVGLQGGYGAPEPTADQLHKLALTARTRNDHLTLHEYYSMVAKRKTSEADTLATAAAAYRSGVHHGTYDAALALEQRVRAVRKAATQATEAANRHAVLANIA